MWLSGQALRRALGLYIYPYKKRQSLPEMAVLARNGKTHNQLLSELHKSDSSNPLRNHQKCS